MLKARILTGTVLGIAVVLITLLVPPVPAAAVLGLLWFAGSAEWTRLAGLGTAAAVAFVVLNVAAMTVAIGLGFESGAVAAAIWLAVPGIGLTLAALSRYPAVFPGPVVALTGLLCLLPSWLAFGALLTIEPGLGLAAIVIVWGADVGAYVLGRTLGRHRLAPAISPGKTWEGVGGGLAAALAVGAVAASVLGLRPWFIVLAGAAAAASIVGDLGVSLLKRHAGLKDSGRLLPGHGGALDRIDGLTTGLPIIAIGLQLAVVLD